MSFKALACLFSVAAVVLAIADTAAAEEQTWWSCHAVGAELGDFEDSKCGTESETGSYNLEELESAQSSAISGHITLADTSPGVEVECEATGTGSVGGGPADKLTEVSASKCVAKKGSCGTPKATALHLPWNSEVYEAGSEELRDTLTSSGSGVPGWAVECVVLGIKVLDECTGETNVHVANKPSEGTVAAEFDAKSPAGNCTVGGTGSGTIRGMSEISADSGQAISVAPPDQWLPSPYPRKFPATKVGSETLAAVKLTNPLSDLIKITQIAVKTLAGTNVWSSPDVPFSQGGNSKVSYDIVFKPTAKVHYKAEIAFQDSDGLAWWTALVEGNGS